MRASAQECQPDDFWRSIYAYAAFVYIFDVPLLLRICSRSGRVPRLLLPVFKVARFAAGRVSWGLSVALLGGVVCRPALLLACCSQLEASAFDRVQLLLAQLGIEGSQPQICSKFAHQVPLFFRRVLHAFLDAIEPIGYFVTARLWHWAERRYSEAGAGPTVGVLALWLFGRALLQSNALLRRTGAVWAYLLVLVALDVTSFDAGPGLRQWYILGACLYLCTGLGRKPA
jgi:hypothetical protein